MAIVKIHDSFMHHTEAGAGRPVVFLHGNPTSSYVWRNVLPHVTGQARALAPDLIGMGDSGKPDIGYRFVDHVHYLDAWFDAVSFDEFRADLADGLADRDYAGPEAELLATEVRLTCSQAMLQCLDRAERVAFVLSDVFELSSTEAAWILDVTPAAYRKRLERARQRLKNFMGATCGLVNSQAFCRCSRRVDKALVIGRVDPKRPMFAAHPVNGRGVAEISGQMHELHDAATVIRAHPDYAAPRAKTDAVLALLRSGRFPMLE